MISLLEAKITVDEKNVNPSQAVEKRPCLPAGRHLRRSAVGNGLKPFPTKNLIALPEAGAFLISLGKMSFSTDPLAPPGVRCEGSQTY